MKLNHTAHKALWLWLAENPDKPEIHWPGWSINGGSFPLIINECFACEYAKRCLIGEECPLEWPMNKDGNFSCNSGGLFSLWLRSEDGPKSRARLARQIANLPVKPGVECE